MGHGQEVCRGRYAPHLSNFVLYHLLSIHTGARHIYALDFEAKNFGILGEEAQTKYPNTKVSKQNKAM